MKLGKTPARVNAVQLRLSTYLNLGAILPLIPAEFGHEDLVPEFEMLGNDQYGDCVWAGAAHETILWNREAGRVAPFHATAVLSDYTAVTGFDATDPATDRGTDMQVAASYRRRIGIVDADGARHRIGAYVALTPGDPELLAAAAFIFGAIGVGLRMPTYALEEFETGQPWAIRHGVPQLAGGHYVPVIGRRGGNFLVVTWGRVHEMTEGFYRRYCDEAIVYFSEEFLTAGVSPEGFDRAQLLIDLLVFTRR